MYEISQASYNIAKKMNLVIKKSTLQNKKLDVYKNGQKIASIGDVNYFDYQMYKLNMGLDYAKERRRLYMIRHRDDIKKKDSNGYFAFKLLWN